MQKIIKTMLAVIILAVGGSASIISQSQSVFASEDNSIPQVPVNSYLDNIKGTKQINVKEYLNLVNNSDTKKDFIVYFGFKDCPYCRAESVYLKEFIKETRYPIYYINMEESLNDATEEDLQKMDESLKPYIFYGTPTFTFFRDNKIENMLIGYPLTVQDLENIDDSDEYLSTRMKSNKKVTNFCFNYLINVNQN